MKDKLRQKSAEILTNAVIIYALATAILGFTSAKAQEQANLNATSQPIAALVGESTIFQQEECPPGTTFSDVCEACIPDAQYSKGICPSGAPQIIVQPTPTYIPTDFPDILNTTEFDPIEVGSSSLSETFEKYATVPSFLCPALVVGGIIGTIGYFALVRK